eukprot:scaffold1384_cov256-Pinguiococcus_pyrenoidosus.AAC.12
MKCLPVWRKRERQETAEEDGFVTSRTSYDQHLRVDLVHKARRAGGVIEVAQCHACCSDRVACVRASPGPAMESVVGEEVPGMRSVALRLGGRAHAVEEIMEEKNAHEMRRRLLLQHHQWLKSLDAVQQVRHGRVAVHGVRSTCEATTESVRLTFSSFFFLLRKQGSMPPRRPPDAL